jgi:crotonobetainyl-CoA:carnitine CoA-transferase CaiB-like acyl-CoA transferase
VIDEAMPSKTTAEWLVLLREADIPCGPINTLDDLFDEPQLTSGGFFRTEQHPTEGKLKVTRHPIDFSSVSESATRPAPRLGEHGREVLTEAGLSDAEIEALAASGALRLTGE